MGRIFDDYSKEEKIYHDLNDLVQNSVGGIDSFNIPSLAWADSNTSTRFNEEKKRLEQNLEKISSCSPEIRISMCTKLRNELLQKIKSLKPSENDIDAALYDLYLDVLRYFGIDDYTIEKHLEDLRSLSYISRK